MKVNLKQNLGFSWYKNNHISFKGYFYINHNFYEKEEALNYLSKCQSKVQFQELIQTLNGVYSIIISFKSSTIIVSDTTRSFPIFYSSLNDDIYISDDILYLKDILKIENFDATSELELKASLHTYGKKTLLTNVFQVQSDECLVIENNTITESVFSFSYAVKSESTLSYNDLKKEAIQVFDKSFQRLITSLKNKTAVIPLSAGFDSRLIATMLKRHNFKDVVCYTYGRKNSYEIENSKKVAQELGFQWYFIEYTDELITNFLSSSEFKMYAHHAGKLSSMPYMQEYFAIKYLKEKKLIPKNAVFIPGFAGDLLGGSQFLKVIPEDLKHTQIIDLIIKHKFTSFPLSASDKTNIQKDLKKSLLNFDSNYENKIPSSVFEDFDLKEKIAKYIFNSASFYTYFGFEYRFPFWDKETLTFFKSLPVKHKKMKALFDDVLINHYFKPENIYFNSEIQPSQEEIFTQRIKNKIKPMLPVSVKKKFLKKNDWNNYEAITKKMLIALDENNLTVKLKSDSYNEIIAQWYIYFSKNKIT